MKDWLAPSHYERRYGKFLAKTAEQLRKELLARLSVALRLQDTDSPVELDTEEIELAIASVLAWVETQKQERTSVLLGYFSIVNLFNDRQFIEVVRSETGVTLPSSQYVKQTAATVTPSFKAAEVLGDAADVFRQELYLPGIANNWVSAQQTIIDKAVSQLVADAELIVRNAAVSSFTKKATVTAIDALFETASRRLVDTGQRQVAQLNTQLTAQRERSLGADEYIWLTRRDERVRGNPGGIYPKAKPSHFHRDGQVFSWSHPPEGGHPGEAPGCRCKAVLRLPRK